MAEMRPEDVPATLVQAAANAIHAHYEANPDDDSENGAIRILLAAVLPLHERPLRTELENLRAQMAAHRPGPILRAWRSDDGDIVHGDAKWIHESIQARGGQHVIADTCTWVSNWREIGGNRG